MDGSPGFRAPHCGALWFRSVPDSPVSQTGKNHRFSDRWARLRVGGWVGREAGPPVVGPVQMQATGRLSLTFSL